MLIVMKRLLLSLVACLAATALWAQQASIVPQWQVGDSAVYTKSATVTSEGAGRAVTTVKSQAVQAVTVLQRTATGYVVAVNTLSTSFNIEGSSNPTVDSLQTLLASDGDLLRTRVLYATDATGRPLEVLNLPQVQQEARCMLDTVHTWLDGRVKSQGIDLESMLSRDVLDSVLLAPVTSEHLLQLAATSPLFLYGKTIATDGGEYTTWKPATEQQGAHVERLATSRKSADELVAAAMQQPMMQRMLKALPPSMHDMVKQQLRAQLGGGRVTIEAATYDYYPNGWASKIEDTTTVTQGNLTNTTSTTTQCVYTSWKQK